MTSPWKMRAGGTASTGRVSPDLGMVRRSLAVLADPEHGMQLQRAPFHSQSFATFPGSDIDSQVAWVERNDDALGIYYALNPVPLTLAHSLRVADVIRRRWLLIDVDRDKTHDPDDSATDAEHQQAKLATWAISDYLTSDGFPLPVVVDSGNGWHLLYRVDLPNDALSRQLIKALLEALAGKFPGPCKIGVECHDARRVSKLPGTWARRGKQSTERPWRMAKLAELPAVCEVVAPELIRDVTQRLTAPQTPPAPDAQETLIDVPVPSSMTLTATGGDADKLRAYAKAAFEKELEILGSTLAGSQQRNIQLNKSAFALGQLVAANWSGLNRLDVETGLTDYAQQIGLGDSETVKTIKSGIEAGMAQPRPLPDGMTLPKPSKDGRATSNGQTTQPPPPPKIWRLPQLLSEKIPPPRWAVPGLMSEGLTILAGKPKLGKSWLALNLALTIAAGGKALTSMPDVEPGDVLYLALEDRLRRVQDRAKKLLLGIGCSASERLHIAIEWPRQNQGGLDMIQKWMESVIRPTVVIIDVWAKFRTTANNKASAYDQDYEAASQVKSLGDRFNCSMLPLHHCKKAAAEDALDEISGTLGLAGAADGALILTRARGENEANLFMTGRDIDENNLALEFDPATCCWKSLGDAKEITANKTKASVIALFKAHAGATIGVKEIAAAVKVPPDREHYLRSMLHKMVDQGLIERAGTGKFRYPVQPAVEF